MSKNIIVLDVEGMSGKRPYNIGFLVADLKGHIYEEYSFAIMPAIWENLETAIKTVQIAPKEMTHKNIQEILQNNKKYQWELLKIL